MPVLDFFVLFGIEWPSQFELSKDIAVHKTDQGELIKITVVSLLMSGDMVGSHLFPE